MTAEQLKFRRTILLDVSSYGSYSILMTTKNTTEYWTARNALVDAAHAARPAGSLWHGEANPVEVERYRAALDALKEFDRQHGGAPVL